MARGAIQMAEDARVLTLQRKEQERIAAEKRAQEEARAKAEAEAKEAAAKEAQARAQSEEDAKRRAQAEADRQAAEQAKAEAEKAKAEAEVARAAALVEQQKAEQETEKARQAAADAIRQKEEMRARLLNQLNQVLETKDTDRGLVVSMPDVLFDSGQYTLKPAARERLARVAGIVTAYPELMFEVEGHTDSTGSDDYNQLLSEKRAATVRDYMVNAGVSINNVVARGFGSTRPAAENTTSAGRKLNRRVEMIVSGDVIGTHIGGHPDLITPTTPSQPLPVSVPQ
jgi:outer membrane protein OmpA-like peptidoglycan-associated protein